MALIERIVHLSMIVAASYLVGSFPTSIIVGRVFFHKDIRRLGSGNAGGTNTFRAFGWKAGVPVILFDVGKGILATLVLSRIPMFAVPGASGAGPALLPSDATMLVAGASAVAGHIWTVFAGFKGGKGVGTAAGMIVSLYPLALGIAALEFALILLATGIVSVGSVVAAISLPVIIVILAATGVQSVSPLLLGFAIVAALLIVYTHRSNLGRIIHGEENRFEKLMLFRRFFRWVSRRVSRTR